MNYNQPYKLVKNNSFDFGDIYDLAVQKYPNGKFLEIGPCSNISAAYMLERAKVEQNYITLYKALEGSLYDPFKKALDDLGYMEKVDYTAFEGLSERDYLSFDGGFFDFIFIDGENDYDKTSLYIECWIDKVKKGGMIGGRDISCPDVEKAVKERFKTIQIINKSWLVNIGEDYVE